jgi:anti-sigma B factor antagonist
VGLSVSVQHDSAGVAQVRPSGDIDLATVGKLDEHIAATIADEKTASVVIDLSQVSFIDSTGIAALLRGRRLADDPPKPYRITGASGLVRQVLELTGVWAHLSAPGS